MMLESSWQWLGFAVLVLTALGLDMGLFHKQKDQEISLRSALFQSLGWISLALLFNLWILFEQGKDPAAEFFTAYLIEKALSIDNIFVFLTLFSYFKVPAAYQFKVLRYGILGAIAFRGIFIGFGVGLIQRFDWILTLFGGILVASSIRMLFHKENQLDLDQNLFIRMLKRVLRIIPQYIEDRLIVRRDGKTYFTVLFLVLALVELSDIIFAVDSIPAVLGITQHAYIAFTSNILAILGLRSLYFVLARFSQQFKHLKYALSIILAFIGLKMLFHHSWVVPTSYALSFILITLTLSVISSLLFARHDSQEHPQTHHPKGKA